MTIDIAPLVELDILPPPEPDINRKRDKRRRYKQNQKDRKIAAKREQDKVVDDLSEKLRGRLNTLSSERSGEGHQQANLLRSKMKVNKKGEVNVSHLMEILGVQDEDVKQQVMKVIQSGQTSNLNDLISKIVAIQSKVR
jgi:hypothetical protein